MAVRHTRRCKNCPQPEPQFVGQAPRIVHITLQSEGEHLWKHVLTGTSSCVSMIEGYAAGSMPGLSVPELETLRDRLDQVINNYEDNDETFDSNPSERYAPADEADGALGQVGDDDDAGRYPQSSGDGTAEWFDT